VPERSRCCQWSRSGHQKQLKEMRKDATVQPA
jgi:hypothetical protein